MATKTKKKEPLIDIIIRDIGALTGHYASIDIIVNDDDPVVKKLIHYLKTTVYHNIQNAVLDFLKEYKPLYKIYNIQFNELNSSIVEHVYLSKRMRGYVYDFVDGYYNIHFYTNKEGIIKQIWINNPSIICNDNRILLPISDNIKTVKKSVITTLREILKNTTQFYDDRIKALKLTLKDNIQYRLANKQTIENIIEKLKD